MNITSSFNVVAVLIHPQTTIGYKPARHNGFGCLHSIFELTCHYYTTLTFGLVVYLVSAPVCSADQFKLLLISNKLQRLLRFVLIPFYNGRMWELQNSRKKLELWRSCGRSPDVAISSLKWSLTRNC